MPVSKAILVATDFGECSQDALEDAVQLAEKLDAKVHLVHVVTLQNSENAAPLPSVALEDTAVSAQRKLSAIAEAHRASGHLGEVVVRRGDPAPTILVAAQDLGADLIVLGTHDRRGLRRLVLGSVAEAVVRRAHCSVLVVRSRS